MNYKKIALITIVCLASFCLGMITAAMSFYSSQIPDLKALGNIEQSETTRFYSADSVLLKKFYHKRRQLATYFEIPDQMRQALIAIEDHRFHKHWGIDIIRLSRVIFIDLLTFKRPKGTSTITQQLARNLFLTQKRKISRKIKEVITAVKIEKMYSKDEIITIYLNDIYLGPGIYGIKAAARYYFNKSVTTLSLSDCAYLAGIIQAPGRYQPEKYHDRAIKRRQMVLKNMMNLGYITKNEFQEANQNPLPKIEIQEIKEAGPYYVEYARQYILENYGYDYLYKGGLSVYLSMDYNYQNYADSISQYFIKKHQHQITHELDSIGLNTEAFEALSDSIQERVLQVAVILMDPATGSVKALVGGRDFDFSEFNRATQARRQPGSSFKPFLYTTALDNGFTPASLILDQPVAMQIKNDELWLPKNDDRKVGGFITLRRALKLSKNLVSIRLIGKVKPKTVVFYAHQMGIRSPLNPFASLSMGTSEVTLEELTSAYTTFANLGYHTEPIYINKIIDNQGNALENNEYNIRKKKVLRSEVAFLITDMLKSVINSGTGWSARARGFNFPDVAGKTGTTDDYTDAWFMGFSPYYVCGVWVGNDSNHSMGRNKTGSRMALPIWTEIMKYVHVGKPLKYFQRPSGVVSRKVCKESHLLARPACPDSYDEFFLKENLPQPCDIHTRVRHRTLENINDFDIED